jgi:two-component system, chemotaxis family, response regulator Rcp1
MVTDVLAFSELGITGTQVIKQKNRILLAEDNDGDVFLVRRALEKRGLPHELVLAHNGEEALVWLDHHSGDKNGSARPDLILLDLNLPRVDGGQLLSHIRKSDSFARTPVIVLTSSDSPKDRQMAMELGANLYFRKPTDLASFMDLGRIIEETLQGVPEFGTSLNTEPSAR